MYIRVRDLDLVRNTGAGRLQVLRSVDLDIEAGSFTSIMGPSGSGKSTLLRCMAGLTTPTSGSISVGDVTVTGLDSDARAVLRRREFGFVFQDFELMSALTAAENVELPIRLDSRRPSRDRTVQLLAGVGLADRVDHRPDQMSGGQKQRVAIARALATEPRVIFADEPTGALDVSSARDVLSILRRLADAGHTIVMVTHDPSAAAVSDAVLFLVDGRIAAGLRAPTAAGVSAQLARLAEVA